MKLEVEIDEIATICVMILVVVAIIFASSCEKEKIKHPEYWEQNK